MFHVEQFLDKFLPEMDKKVFIERASFIEQEYMKWNSAINISSIRDKEGFWVKHVLDSLCLVSYIKENYQGYDVMDIGSGGGFPGLILGVCLENKITMVEPIRKKTDFIDHCIRRLSLKNTNTISSKYEKIDIPGTKLLVVSRALGAYEKLYEHFVKANEETCFVLMTTDQQKHSFKTKAISKHYDFINNITNNQFKNNILAEIIR
ncbi:MAG: 16S rRNA (guanine(527)-N(7))-methyltransferase RsmG [bacterium]